MVTLTTNTDSLRARGRVTSNYIWQWLWWCYVGWAVVCTSISFKKIIECHSSLKTVFSNWHWLENTDSINVWYSITHNAALHYNVCIYSSCVRSNDTSEGEGGTSIEGRVATAMEGQRWDGSRHCTDRTVITHTFTINWELTFDSNREGQKFKMIHNCPRYGLNTSTDVISSLRGVEAIKDQSAYETNISGRTNSRNGEVLSATNDIAPWIKPLHC